MIVENKYWVFDSALSHNFCDQVVEFGLKTKEEKAVTGGGGVMEYNNLIRESNIAWLNEPWIYKEIAPYVHTANKNAGWNFNIKGAEKLQFTKYKLNQFYDWHVDAFDKPYKEMGELTGLIRKISVTCQLTDGAEYSGGELQFDFRNYDPDLRETLEHVHTAKEAKNKGTIIVFPSFVWHRVLPVTRGTRYSLVNWICGETFK